MCISHHICFYSSPRSSTYFKVRLSVLFKPLGSWFARLYVLDQAGLSLQLQLQRSRTCICPVILIHSAGYKAYIACCSSSDGYYLGTQSVLSASTSSFALRSKSQSQISDGFRSVPASPLCLCAVAVSLLCDYGEPLNSPSLQECQQQTPVCGSKHAPGSVGRDTLPSFQIVATMLDPQKAAHSDSCRLYRGVSNEVSCSAEHIF